MTSLLSISKADHYSIIRQNWQKPKNVTNIPRLVLETGKLVKQVSTTQRIRGQIFVIIIIIIITTIIIIILFSTNAALIFNSGSAQLESRARYWLS
jgi:hypothetical protein